MRFAATVPFCWIALAAQEQAPIQGVVLEAASVKLSSYVAFEREILVIEASLSNPREHRINSPTLEAVILKKNGALYRKALACDEACRHAFEGGNEVRITHKFPRPWPFDPDEIASSRVVVVDGYLVSEKPGFSFYGFVAKDEACLIDFVKMRALSGLELRKKLAELLQFGCGSIVDELEVVFRAPPITLTVGANKFRAVQAMLRDDRCDAHIRTKCSEFDHTFGWILMDSLTPSMVFQTDRIPQAGRVKD